MRGKVKFSKVISKTTDSKVGVRLDFVEGDHPVKLIEFGDGIEYECVSLSVEEFNIINDHLISEGVKEVFEE